MRVRIGSPDRYGNFTGGGERLKVYSGEVGGIGRSHHPVKS
uniref:Uncharacterized protein n=1 Tax=Desertifilum tharense IPPAS B-1220 TaxID=1781255 RepID=A0ACD5GTX2_9CYAN